MRKEVLVSFAPGREIAVGLHADESPMPADEARRWLDEQFLANECEPLRASGKVLTADKVLALATTVGPARFEDDQAFRNAYARAVIGALGKPVVKVDVDGGAVKL